MATTVQSSLHAVLPPSLWLGLVGRLVRKTGLGQAAGLLASLGLLGEQVADVQPDEGDRWVLVLACVHHADKCASSDDEAEEEERRLFAQADPITARRSEAVPPAELTDEEKEARYWPTNDKEQSELFHLLNHCSAAELVQLIRRLNALGVFKCNVPGVTDED